MVTEIRIYIEGGGDSRSTKDDLRGGYRAFLQDIYALASTKRIRCIAVVGHVGLHPQAVDALGGLKVQGKDIETARKVVSEALALQDAGVFAIIFEVVPAKLSAYVTRKLRVPTISIGGGPGCSGQLLVTLDVLGLFDRFTPSLVKKYQDVGTLMLNTFKQYGEEVRAGIFPGNENQTGSIPKNISC